jgi:hypothetical protein
MCGKCDERKELKSYKRGKGSHVQKYGKRTKVDYVKDKEIQ